MRLATESVNGLLQAETTDALRTLAEGCPGRKNEIALCDLASGRCWTFAQLNEEAEKPLPGKPAMVHPQGNSPEFVLSVLRAWRERVVVCPLDAHHQPLAVSPPPWPCCHLKTTPASTGVPRAVAFTQEQLFADAENIVTTMGLRPDWPNLGVISLAYSYGFSSLVLPLLLRGIPLYLVPSPLPVALRCAAHAHWNFTVPAVPALWHAWHKAGAILSNVRLAISAGAPLPLSLERAVFAEHGVKIHNFYGSTECGGIAYDATATPRAEESSVGRPLKNVNVEIGGQGVAASAQPRGGRNLLAGAGAGAGRRNFPDVRFGGNQERRNFSARPHRRPHQCRWTESFPDHHRAGVARARGRGRMRCLWRAQRERGPDGPDCGVRRGGPADFQGRPETISTRTNCRAGRCRANGGSWIPSAATARANLRARNGEGNFWKTARSKPCRCERKRAVNRRSRRCG